MPPTTLDAPPPRAKPNGSRILHAVAIIALLALATAAAWDGVRRDSITFDEPAHLAAGLSFWQSGDFRLLYATPPLAQLWATAPLASGP